jgi:predicted amidohydrolase
MQKQLNTFLIQADLLWEDPAGNREQFDKKIGKIKDADLIILPEMFTSGFTMNPKPVAEKMNGESVNWMMKKAAEKNALLTGSLIIEENNKYYNRLITAFPDGKISFYDKKHLFSYAKEDQIFTAGNKHLIIEYKGFRIMPLICYDLRFPVWARNIQDYDILIYVANWPVPRIGAWDLLLKARAIENMSYVIGVNRVGKDGNKIQYSGHSAVIDTFGKELLTFDDAEEGVKSVKLDPEHIKKVRERFRFLNDRDSFKM